MARNPLAAAQPGICPSCGAKVRADRRRCPRCRASLAPPDPAVVAALSRKLRMASAVLAAGFLIVVGTLWILQDPEPVTPPAGPVSDPMAGRRAMPAPQVAAAPPMPDMPLAERPFLDPPGAGYAAYVAGDYEAALAKFEEAVTRNPRDAESLSNLGQVLVRLNRAAEALPFFERAIAEIPDRWAYHFNLARALGVLSRWPEAVAAYRRAQQLFPDDYATSFNLALALHRTADYTGAVEQYQKAIALAPNDPTFRMALGMAYERLQKTRDAVAAYEEALKLAPQAPDADKVRARIAQLSSPSAAGS